jgi:hypothetical protein
MSLSPIHRPCCSFVPPPRLFDFPAVRWHWCSLALALVFAGIGICWRWCLLALAFGGIGIGIGVRWRWRSVALAFGGVRWHWCPLVFVVVVNLSSIIISTIISPYEQWLVGGVVVLYNAALGGVAARPRCRWWCPCCCIVALSSRNRTHCHPASRGSQQRRRA